MGGGGRIVGGSARWRSSAAPCAGAASHSPAAYHWVLTHEQIAADPYLEDAIAHLEWRGIARRFDAEDGVTVIFEEQT